MGTARRGIAFHRRSKPHPDRLNPPRMTTTTVCPTPRGARWTCRLAWDRQGSASRPLLLQRFCVRQECFQQEGKNVRDLSPLLREDRLAALAAWALCAITASALSICGRPVKCKTFLDELRVVEH